MTVGVPDKGKACRSIPQEEEKGTGAYRLLVLGMVLGFGSPLALVGLMGPVFDNPLTVKIPEFAIHTLTRMTLAYLLSLGFALAYGISTAMSHRASHVMLPLLDILQSVPVLGFVPVVFIFFLTNFPGSLYSEAGISVSLGAEISSILLIFTAMVWAPTFGVIAGVNAIPQDIKEAARAYGVRGFTYLRQIVLPAVFPELVWSSLLAWGGGWYLIPVEEYFTFGQTCDPTGQCLPTAHKLPGLGFYIADAAARQDLASSLFGLAVLVSIILAIDWLVWRPLGARAEKYKYESTAAPQAAPLRGGRVAASVRKYEGRLVSPIVSFLKYEKTYLTSFLETVHLRPKFHLSDRIRLQERMARHTLWGRLISVVIALTILVVSIEVLYGAPLPSLSEGLAVLQTTPGYLALVLDAAASLLRIFTAYLIALAWTLAAGIVIARNERLSKLLVPLFDIGQSIPATALFPIIVLLVVNPFQGNPVALNLASILLLLTGMQWYLLFNIVGAVRALPTDLLEASSAYRVTGRRFIREILVPASYPAILIGSIQAWGGGWNATIVSEYISDPKGGAPHTVPGLGSLLVMASNSGNLTPLESGVIIAAAILIMTATVLTINRLVWRRLLRRAEKYKLEA